MSSLREDRAERTPSYSHRGGDRAGVGYARRGWLEAGDVLNTRSWAELERLLRR